MTEYSPTEQFEHAVRPSWLFHVPGSQILHVDTPAACAYPLLQEQDACDELPDTDTAFAWHGTHDEFRPVATEYVSAAQLVHRAEPFVDLKVPAGHAVHGTFCSGTDPTTSISAICM